jgi:nucleoside-diphosphate-sugar epimerase
LFEHKVDAIVHLAATCGGIGINKDNPGRFIYENLQMGVNILEAARLAGVKKVINLGSVCAYPKHTSVPFSENDLWKGYPEETNAPYGIAKKTIIEMGIAYSRQYGMNVVNLLPANMYGEHDNFDEYSSHVIPAIIKKFECPLDYCSGPESLDDESYRSITLWGTGQASREFLYAGDLARAISVAIAKDVGPEPINIGTGQEITITDLAEMIKRIGGYDAKIMWDTSQPDGQPRRSLSTSRAEERLRWEARMSLEEGIRKTINWYRNE